MGIQAKGLVVRRASPLSPRSGWWLQPWRTHRAHRPTRWTSQSSMRWARSLQHAAWRIPSKSPPL